MAVELGVAMRQLVLFLSACTAGLALFMAWRRVTLFYRDHRLKDLGHFVLDVHVAGLVALIAYLIFGVPRIMPGWKTYAYAEILLGIGVGLLIIAATTPRLSSKGGGG